MGVLADLKSQAKTFGATSPLRSWIDSQLTIHDPSAPSSTAAKNAVHTVKKFASDPSGGTFTLTVGVRQADGTVESAETAGIAHNANAATIESAIDTALTGVVTSWTNGDITVTGGTLLAAGADVVLTFDGTSVSGKEAITTTIDGSGLTGGSLADPAVVVNTSGQTARAALGALVAYGVIDSATIAKQSAATSVTAYSPIAARVRLKKISTITSGVYQLRLFVPKFGFITTSVFSFSTNGQSQINSTAKIAGVPGYVDDDIKVSGTRIDQSDMVYTYSGNSVKGGSIQPPVIVDFNLSPAPSEAQKQGVIDRSARVDKVPAQIIKLIMREAAAEDSNNSTYYSLQAALFPQDRSPLVETRVAADDLLV